jgi:hypothetical protein
MPMRKKIYALCLCAALCLAGCAQGQQANTTADAKQSEEKTTETGEDKIGEEDEGYLASLSFVEKIQSGEDISDMLYLPENIFLSEGDIDWYISDFSDLQKSSDEDTEDSEEDSDEDIQSTKEATDTAADSLLEAIEGDSETGDKESENNFGESLTEVIEENEKNNTEEDSEVGKTDNTKTGAAKIEETKSDAVKMISIEGDSDTERMVTLEINKREYIIHMVFDKNVWKVDPGEDKTAKDYEILYEGSISINGVETEETTLSLPAKESTIICHSPYGQLSREVTPKTGESCDFTAEINELKKQQEEAAQKEKEAQEADALARSEARAAARSEAAATAEEEAASYDKIIFVGDSRTEGMRDALGTGDAYICKSGEGYSWLTSTAASELAGQVTENSAIVVSLGVNDLYNVGNYLNYFNSMKDMYGCALYINSVDPVDEVAEGQQKYKVYNSEIENFNNIIRSGLREDINYLDSYSHMMDVGFSAPDGVHYSTSTYQEIYNYILGNL